MSRFLTIIEVSQKQAYIFESSKLRDNIARSDEIACITGFPYITETAGCVEGFPFSEENLVYSGGGHTILEFEKKDSADLFVKALTKRILNELPGISLFCRTVEYDETLTPGENIKHLTAQLEKKKSIRRSFFHQGTYGIEEIDRNTGKPVLVSPRSLFEVKGKEEVPPRGFLYTTEFEKLGMTADKSGFIAVIHIDGNAMGKRVEELSSRYSVHEWDTYKKQMRCFSEGIANDFLDSYHKTEQYVADTILAGGLSDLSFSYKEDLYYLPMRRVISEGDDICFVAEGRIGIECAALFLRFLGEKINVTDGKTYSACAGVALVHRKYPFFRAYELAEALCSNAKRFGATLGSTDVSAIDWHIEYGEVQDSLEDTRMQYETLDHKRLELRPYIVAAPEDLMRKEPVRQYENFRSLIKRMTSKAEAYGRGTMKELRRELRRGEDAVSHYLRFHQIEELGSDIWHGIFVPLHPEETAIGSGTGLERKVFARTADGVDRSVLFDVIEIMDAWLPVEEKSE